MIAGDEEVKSNASVVELRLVAGDEERKSKELVSNAGV